MGAALATLTVLTDWASVYTAVAMGVDPSPIGPIDTLKAGLAADSGTP